MVCWQRSTVKVFIEHVNHVVAVKSYYYPRRLDTDKIGHQLIGRNTSLTTNTSINTQGFYSRKDVVLRVYESPFYILDDLTNVSVLYRIIYLCHIYHTKIIIIHQVHVETAQWKITLVYYRLAAVQGVWMYTANDNLFLTDGSCPSGYDARPVGCGGPASDFRAKGSILVSSKWSNSQSNS